MKVVIFGATGMVGQGVLRECLLDADVTAVLTVGRSKTNVQSPKLNEAVQPDMWSYRALQEKLTGFDACFFCLGVSSNGMSEAEYERLTVDLTMAAAETLSRANAQMTFVYVSGAGTDDSGKGRTMWARVKGRTENALARLPFKASYMFRPGVIQAMHGAKSKTSVYRIFYFILGPLLPPLRRLFPDYVLTTEQIGRAMLSVAKHGYPTRILESKDIRAAATA